MANQILYITEAEKAALIKMTQTNGETLEMQFGTPRMYVTQDWAIQAVLQLRGKR